MIDIITIKWTHTKKRNNMRERERKRRRRNDDDEELYLRNLHHHAIILRLTVVFLCQSLSFLKVIAHFFPLYRLENKGTKKWWAAEVSYNNIKKFLLRMSVLTWKRFFYTDIYANSFLRLFVCYGEVFLSENHICLRCGLTFEWIS